ncbi:ABC transporter substrate-binding protein [Ectobacillus antri]|jgi:raffinose/stachyose/melibiose transport system substrate-binding protein|uniref:ABC transporter substrate-binding protein n=1 Tax=Ectobacillus antri TaxID=2486280 RepID=UPI000F59A6E7|nr:extracellular solute-binding protein [Ectobacillus antri]
MKKWITGAIAATLFAGIVTGCSSSKTSAKKEPTTISFVHWRGEDVEVFHTLIQKFEQENPEIKVKMNVYPSDQYQSTVQTVLRDGQAGDVFTSFPGAQFETLQKAGLFTDLTKESFTTNFEAHLIENGKKDGKQLALPYQLVFNIPVYNVGIFEKLGLTPPKDWESFLQVNEKLKANGYIPIAFPGADIGPGQFMNSMVMNNAPSDQSLSALQKGETKLTDEWWVKTLGQFKELQPYLQKDALGAKHDSAIALIAQEKAAILATGSYAVAGIQKQNPNIRLGLLAPITVQASQAKYEGVHTSTFMLAINSKSKKKGAAKKFLAFLSKQEIATEYANKTAQHVTVKGVSYESPILKELSTWTNKKTVFQPRFTITNANVEKAVTGSIQEVLGGTAPKQAAEAAQKIVEQNVVK